MKYQAVFFPDPYDVGVRDAIMTEDLDELVDRSADYLRQHDCGFTLLSFDGHRWKSLDRVPYRLINQKLGRF